MRDRRRSGPSRGVLCPGCGQSNGEFNPSCSRCGQPLPQNSSADTEPTASPPPPSAPTSTADPLLGRVLGDYRLLEPLGRGSMGAVYRAVHLHSGQAAALKTVVLPDARLLPTIRREVQALSRLRHPGIVRILHSGTDQGIPWYAMELVEGVELRRHCTAAAPASGPAATAQSLPAVLTVLRRLCAALGYLHGEGIVHRDLKPENILIKNSESGILNFELELQQNERQTMQNPRSGIQNSKFRIQNSPWPVIVDFGLASEFTGPHNSREALVLEAGGGGTLLYMAPEQLQGHAIDAWTDLYALGCILFELLAGRPPFVGSTAQEVLDGHLRRPAPRLSALVPEVPAALDELLLRLLAKSPRERIGHADVVAAALLRLGAEDGDATGSPHAPAVPRPRVYLYRSGFSGREEPMLQLAERLQRLQRHGAGGVVLLGGESGVGKTRLLAELGRRAARQGLQVLLGECSDRGGVPLEALSKVLQLVADRCRAGGRSETERLLGRRGPVLGLYEPELLGLPGQVEAHAETQNPASEHAPLPADAARLQLNRYLAATLTALTAEPRAASSEQRATTGTEGPHSTHAARRAPPLLLLLDDLQWADELTIGFLDYWLRTRAPGTQQAAPVLVVGAYRSEEVGLGPVTGGAQHAAPLRRLIEAQGLVRIELGRLDEAAVGSIVGDMLALERPPQPFVRYLSRQSEGNPFFVAEYLRAAVEAGTDERAPLLWRDGEGRWQIAEPGDRVAGEQDYAALALPGSIRELVSRRLEGLPVEALRLAEAAAVLGRETATPLLRAAARFEDEALDEALGELLRRQVLEPSGPGQLRFVHDKLREIALERLDAGRRTGLHRAAAEAIEAQPAEVRDGHLAALGRHWELAGQSARAQACYLEGARRAARRYAHEEAERLYRGYLRLVEDPTQESITARNELGELLLPLHRRHEEAMAEHGRALDEARRMGVRSLEAESLRLLATARGTAGWAQDAFPLYEEALELFQEIGDRGSEGKVLGSLAVLHHRQWRMEEARELFDRALSLHRQAGNQRSEGVLLGNLAILHQDQGRMEEARHLMEQALGLHRQVGNRWSEGVVLGNLAILQYQQGRLDEARQLYEQALGVFRQLGNARSEGNTLGNLAILCRDQGSLEEARRFFEQALDLHRQSGDQGWEGSVLDSLAQLERLAGDLERARELTVRSEKFLSAGEFKLDLGRLFCGRGHAALAGGESGRPWLERAQVLASEIGAGGESALAKAVSKLRRAVEAFEAGRHELLFQGELIEELPEGLRRRLIETGALRGEPERGPGQPQPR